MYLFNKHVLPASYVPGMMPNTGDKILNHVQCFPSVLLRQTWDQIITIGLNRCKKKINCVMNRGLLGYRKGTQLGEIREDFKEELMHMKGEVNFQ